MAPELHSPLAVVCHDAGACNVILPWLRRPGLELRAVMQGPAQALFAERFAPRATCSLDEALGGAAMLLSGSGWASDLEHRARMRARRRGIRSVAVIDHWVNYRERFVRSGELVWPDEFWVTDPEALELAQRTFAHATVRRFDNLYLQAMVAQIGPAPADAGVLYVLEPMRSDWGRGMPGEFQALHHFIVNRQAAGITADLPIRLRPHPSDPAGKYLGWLATTRAAYPALDLAMDAHAGLADAVAASRWVAGCETMALVVALMAGRQVLSTLPPWAPKCRLPHAGLRHLRELISA